jgi:hypothetical protein
MSPATDVFVAGDSKLIFAAEASHSFLSIGRYSEYDINLVPAPESRYRNYR